MILRKLTVDDLNFLLEVRNDESTKKFLENDSEFTYDECKSWFESNNPLWFIIEVDGESVGYIRTNGDEVGCDIHPNFRKKGYARQAYNLYLEDKKYATLWVFENNFAKKLYESLGFIEVVGEVKTIRDNNYINMVYNKPILSADLKVVQNVNYIVSFYNGPRRCYSSDRGIEFATKHIEFLNNNLPNIGLVSFVIQESETPMDEELIEFINSTDIKFNYEVILRENEGLSYGGFSSVMRKNHTNYGWSFIIEDDYIPESKDFLNYFWGEFKPDVIYVCSLVQNKYASISTGMISNNLIRGNVHLMTEYVGTGYDGEGGRCQVHFMTEFYSLGFCFTDICNVAHTLFLDCRFGSDPTHIKYPMTGHQGLPLIIKPI